MAAQTHVQRVEELGQIPRHDVRADAAEASDRNARVFQQALVRLRACPLQQNVRQRGHNRLDMWPNAVACYRKPRASGTTGSKGLESGFKGSKRGNGCALCVRERGAGCARDNGGLGLRTCPVCATTMNWACAQGRWAGPARGVRAKTMPSCPAHLFTRAMPSYRNGWRPRPGTRRRCCTRTGASCSGWRSGRSQSRLQQAPGR